MQGDKTVDEHVQDFERAALEAGYEGFPLIVEFKRSLHPALRKRLSEIRPQPVTMQEWYNKSITINRQWRISKAEEAFYGKTNQSGAVRKNPQAQAGTSSERNAPRSSYNNYGQGGYQNRSQQSGRRWCLVKITNRDKKIPMPWMLTERRSADLPLNVINARSSDI